MPAFEFIEKWQNYNGTEKAGAQQFFLELCYLLDVPPPDPNGDGNYSFEKRVLLDGEYKFADVYRAGYFVFGFKRPGKNLQEAVWQATRYAIGLDNPPVVIVSDLWNIDIHTRFTGRSNLAIHLSLPSLEDPVKREVLVWALTEPCRLEKFTSLEERRQEAIQSSRARVPLAATPLRTEIDLVTNFLNRVNGYLHQLSINRLFGQITGRIPLIDWRALMTFGPQFDPATHNERTYEPAFQPLQDSIVAELMGMHDQLRYFQQEFDFGLATNFYVLNELVPTQEMSRLQLLNERKARVVQQISDLRFIVRNSRTVYR